jgi:pyruvate kinase
MIAREDMGMKIPMENIFITQKYMIEKANNDEPIITATKIL